MERPRTSPWALLVALACGCSSTGATVAAGFVGATALGGATASNQIEQVYYLGLFDPHEQVPQAVYRVRVRGQASFISNTRFASGWLPAATVDTLSSQIGFDFEDGGRLKVEEPGIADSLTTGRRLMTFGPEGFRQVPRDHRLVVVMGSDPGEFFKAAGELMENVVGAEVALLEEAATRAILEEMLRISAERRRLADLAADVALDDARSEAKP